LTQLEHQEGRGIYPAVWGKEKNLKNKFELVDCCKDKKNIGKRGVGGSGKVNSKSGEVRVLMVEK